uniref:Uncharacterized protein n=1 Tax=Pithovirus LCPAC103 TaxID=2506588 RepID=A0A481Z6T7_9VIRU|nr:MAG: uncharacterized protein LCPAC103_01120 [Pithovirus LCPAC103]
MGTSNSARGYPAGYSQNESIFVQLWFWMIVIGVILLIIAAIDYAARRQARWWTWVLIGIGAGLVTLGIILGALYANRRPSYPQHGYGYPQPALRAGCAPGVVGSAPQYVQPQYVQPGVAMVPAGAAVQPAVMQPMAVTAAPTVLPTPGAPITTIHTPVLATASGIPHTVVTTSAAAPVRVG